jgi:hypothetical protein
MNHNRLPRRVQERLSTLGQQIHPNEHSPYAKQPQPVDCGGTLPGVLTETLDNDRRSNERKRAVADTDDGQRVPRPRTSPDQPTEPIRAYSRT